MDVTICAQSPGPAMALVPSPVIPVEMVKRMMFNLFNEGGDGFFSVHGEYI